MKKSLFVLLSTLILFATLVTPTLSMADGNPSGNCSPTGRMCKP